MSQVRPLSPLPLLFGPVPRATGPFAIELGLDTLEFRDTEAFTDIPQSERRMADLVVQVRTVGGAPRLLLIHVEVQRERELRFSWRMRPHCCQRLDEE